MSNAAAATVQTATYGAERTKQETEAAHNKTAATASGTQDDFQSRYPAQEAHVKKEAAVSEGKADVEHAKATAGSYLDQARSLVDTALGTAQSYVVAGQERLGATTTHSTAHVKSTGSEGPKQGGIKDTLSGAAMSALETTKASSGCPGEACYYGPDCQTSCRIRPGYSPAPPAKATVQPQVNAVKEALPDSVVDTSKPTSAAQAARANSATSPSTISYPKEPKTESHHVTTEASAAPERVDDKAVEKLADNLTTTKLTNAAPASTA
ncbi:hypothetical protein RhiLY_11065 [Ceratobasidium sp. AG-Ba]|nr:hypothetical protein RhiLY_11065 [Ceratobasidium sp. AG-Ba]